MEPISTPAEGDREQQSEIDDQVAFARPIWRVMERSALVLARTNTVLSESHDRLTIGSTRIAETRRRILSSRLRQAHYG